MEEFQSKGFCEVYVNLAGLARKCWNYAFGVNAARTISACGEDAYLKSERECFANSVLWKARSDARSN